MLIGAVTAQINPLVLQKNHIFKGSIEENIRYGNMNADFTEIETAARKAYLHDQNRAASAQIRIFK